MSFVNDKEAKEVIRSELDKLICGISDQFCVSTGDIEKEIVSILLKEIFER